MEAKHRRRRSTTQHRGRDKIARELQVLQTKYDLLHAQQEELLSKRVSQKSAPSSLANSGRHEPIDYAAIALFVDELMRDPAVNIYYLPDIAEKQLYINVIKMFLGLLQKSVNGLRLEFIGHEIRATMRPVAN